MDNLTLRTYGRGGLQTASRSCLLDPRQISQEEQLRLLSTGEIEWRSAYVDDDLTSVLVRAGVLSARRRKRPGLCLPIDPEQCRKVLEGLPQA